MGKKFTNNEFVERLKLINNKIFALDEYIGMNKQIRFQCENGHVWLALPYNIMQGMGCPYCSGHKVWIGFNDLWTTRPDVALMLQNPSDGFRYTFRSNKKTDFICPTCGNINHKSIDFVSTHGICCQLCSDGISYPNKFIRQVLKQLGIDFIPEYSPDWAKPRKYDCYFEYNGQEYIVEMDGAFHYMDRPSIKKLAEESHAVDELKTQLANRHGIDVIRVNSIESNLEYLKNKILSSKLNDIFDLSGIDWVLCDSSAQKSLVKEACDLYMSGIQNIKKIALILNVHHKTARDYLKLGVKFGWCDYSDQRFKPVVVLDDDFNIMYYFKSGALCSREMEHMYGIKFGTPHITKSCQNHKSYKGFNFRFANETIQN